MMGTGNWGWRYFDNTIDASLFIAGKAPARTLEAIFDRDWNGPCVRTIEPGGRYRTPRIR